MHLKSAIKTIATVGVLALVALGTATSTPALAQQPAMPPSKIQEMMKRVLPEAPGRETIVITIDIPPGGGSPAHRHPGHHIFGYVAEGAYRFKVGDKPEVVLQKGETFYEAPGDLHAVSRNASNTEPAKLLVVIVAEQGKPLTVIEK